MRIISVKKLRDFWSKYLDAEQPLRAWYAEAKRGDWSSAHEIKQMYRSASVIGGPRIVFNIGGNKYRLVVAVRYDFKIFYIRFIGTHAQYNKIDAREVYTMAIQIHSIRTRKDYENALKMIDGLWDAKPGSPEADALDVLTTLVEVYEGHNFAMLPPNPVEAIKFRADQMGLAKSEVAAILGGANRLSEIFHKKRKLSLTMIRRLHQKMRIPYESLIRG